MTLLGISEKLERLVARLPEPLRKPLLREITPVKDLFLRQRPPRLLLLGDRSVEKAVLINALFGCEVVMPDPSETGAGAWQNVSRAGRGTLQYLDGRNLANIRRIQSSLGSELPDLIIFLAGQAEPIASEMGEQAENVIRFMAQRQDVQPAVVGLVVMNTTPSDPREEKEAVQSLAGSLRSLPNLKNSLIESLALVTPLQQFGPCDTETTEGGLSGAMPDVAEPNPNPIAEVVAFALPNDAKLEMARLSGVRSVQEHIAKILVRSMTAASGAIGAQPIPLADFPILTTLQAMTVAGIMVVSGREMTMKLATEFMAALGANIGVGLAFREGARAMLKFFPGWGNAISGAVASAGTYAVGKAATAYFIEGVSLKDARKLFRRSKKSTIDHKRLGR